MSNDRVTHRFPTVPAPFIACPVPESWLRQCSKAGSAALKTAIGLLMVYNRARMTTFAAGGDDLATKMDLDRRTVVAGLQQLEKAGLISVVRQPGRKNRIHLCRFEAQPPSPSALTPAQGYSIPTAVP